MICLMFFYAGLFLFEWTIYWRIHWITLIIGILTIAFGHFTVWKTVLTYLIGHQALPILMFSGSYLPERLGKGMLCDICSNLGPYTYLNSDSSCHEISEYTLSHIGASSGTCHLCRLLLGKALAYPNVDKEGIKISVSPGQALNMNRRGNGSAIYWDAFPFCSRNSTVEYSSTSGGDEPQCKGRLVEDDAASLPCMKIARKWLKNCLESHDRCMAVCSFTPENKSPVFPGRMLDLGSPPGSTNIRLIAAGGIQAEYVALSHTWGDVKPFGTIYGTLNARMNEILFCDLPKTFQDAIVITRNLGCRYLWIDSLCIIQDSADDWQRESAKMRHVYRHSLLTISALHSINSNAGILSPRTATTAVEVAPEKSPGQGPIFVTTAPPSWNEVLGTSILNTRGWALQERLLSPRILHFSKDELLWECLNCVHRERTHSPTTKIRGALCEKSYTGPTLDVNMPAKDWSKQMTFLSFFNEWAGGESKQPYLTWYIAVSNYSGRNLTFGKDKLPAISGFAAEVQLQTGATYVAGLWTEDLLNGLCWQIYPNMDASAIKRSPEFRAPSWSWASLNGKVEYYEPPSSIRSRSGGAALPAFEYTSSDLDGPIQPHVSKVQVHPKGLDPLGEVSAGYICLSCIVIPVFIIANPKSTSFVEDHKVLVVFEARSLPVDCWNFEADRVRCRGIIDSVEDHDISKCGFVPIARRKANYRDCLVALLIAEVPDMKATFRRIGVSWMSDAMAMKLFSSVKGQEQIILI